LIAKTILFVAYIILGILFAEWIIKDSRFTSDEKLATYATMILFWPLGVLTMACVVGYVLFTER
jgi:peptidoglycan biosynthesis protein MviN/MurJ (putative lipid II flippase)